MVGTKRKFADLRRPIRGVEGKKFTNVHVPAPAGHQKFMGLRSDALEGHAEIIQQQDVAIYMAEEFVKRELLGAIVNARQILRTVSVSARVGYMPDAKFTAHLGCACIVPKKQNFNVRIDALPTSQGITLDHINVTLKRFGRREESQHRGIVTRAAMNTIENLS